MSHTKGEWSFEKGFFNNDNNNLGFGTIVGDGWNIAEIIPNVKYFDHSGKVTKESIANAKLIAAAPDMLEALKSSVFHVELARDRNKKNSSLWREIDAELALIKQVIRKATE